MSYSNVGYCFSPGAVVPSAIILKNPTGACGIENAPLALVCTGVPICSGRLLLLAWLVRNRRIVTPEMGLLLLSRTTPLIVVFAGLPGALADALNEADTPVFPAKFACTMLLSLPGWVPKVSTAIARPLLSVMTVWLGSPPMLPPPWATVKVTGTLGTRL